MAMAEMSATLGGVNATDRAKLIAAGWATHAQVLHPTHYTLHTTHYTLHTSHYTLHPTPYTLHPTPCIECSTAQDGGVLAVGR